MTEFSENSLNPILKYRRWELQLNLSLERVLNVIFALDEEEEVPENERIQQLDRFYLVLDNLLDINSDGVDCFTFLDEMLCEEQ